METYKKKVHESQKQIKLLETKNIELQQSLESHSQLTSLPRPPSSKSIHGNTSHSGNVSYPKEGSYLKRHSHSSHSNTSTEKSPRQG